MTKRKQTVRQPDWFMTSREDAERKAKQRKAKQRRRAKAKERAEALQMLEAMSKPDTFWPKLAAELKTDRSRLFYGWGESAVPGVKTIEAVHPSCGCPLATVWFRWISAAQIDILYSFVRPGIRRCGIRTYLHERLLQTWPDARITTNSGTLDGIAWMTKVGFKYHPPGEWVFERKPCPPNKPARGRASR